jgi:hypothetical protein
MIRLWGMTGQDKTSGPELTPRLPSCPGYNYPDETYIRQVHKWLELTFVQGCR